MLFKLSLKNIKKSIKDYSIYFFTLVFAVAMFYTFNSVDAQSSMLVLNNSKYQIVEVLVQVISYVSIFVSIILGFLIVYSNNFLIKKRKKEIGLYFTLGMSKKKVSTILFFETIAIGIISLIIGLLFGIFLSQFLSIFTAKLFEVDLTSYKFVFSKTAFIKTIIYFGIIYVLVILFNTYSLSRYKLIDLINAKKKNEEVKIRNKYVTIITFILSVGLLGYAYYLLFDKVLLMMDYKTIVMLACGAIGTFLLFFSLSGFLLKIIQKSKLYYRNLNIFTLRQVNNKINTSVISTTIICLMLLLTIGILSGSMSLAKVFNTDLKDNNLTDFTIGHFNYQSDEVNPVMKDEYIKEYDELIKNNEFNSYTDDYAVIHKYMDKDLTVSSMMTDEARDKVVKEYGANVSSGFTVPVISETDYKNIMKVLNKESIEIGDNEYLLMTNIDFIYDAYKDYYEQKTGVTVNNTKLIPANDKIVRTAIENYNTAGNDGLLVVSDNLVKDLDISTMSIIGNFVDNNDVEKMGEDFDKFIETNLDSDHNRLRTRSQMEASSLGLKVMIIFMGLYLGITFAISSATVLAIGQLSESSDNKERYKVLKDIGADNKMINKALFTQIAITFTFPLVVALIHSYFGLREINNLIIAFGSIDLTSNILLTTLFMIVVYGGYFLLTYICSKNIIKN